MNWISVKDRLPEPNENEYRYLVMTKCNHKTHNLLAYNYPFPCGEVNIAYYDHFNKWHYSSTDYPDPTVEITHWMPLPNPPKE